MPTTRYIELTFSNPIIWVQSQNWRLPVTFHVVYTRHYLVNTPNWDATDAKHRGFDPDLLGSMLSDYMLGPASNEKTKEQAAKKNCFRAAKGHGIRNIFFLCAMEWPQNLHISQQAPISIGRYFPQVKITGHSIFSPKQCLNNLNSADRTRLGLKYIFGENIYRLGAQF